MPIARRHSALLEVEEPSIFWGYPPVTNALPKLLLARAELFGDLPPGNDEELIKQIEQQCRSRPKQVAANSAVARAIIEWRNEEKVFGRIVQHNPLRMSVDTLRYCADVVAVKNSKAWVLNLDCRSSLVLSGEGREFIKSLIYHTALIGDLRDAGAAILRVPSIGNGKRKVIFEEFSGDPKFSLDEILKRVRETYAIWELIQRDRKTGEGKTGEP